MSEFKSLNDDIQAAYDYMDATIEASQKARNDLAYWKLEHDKMSHECARLRLVIARLKKQFSDHEPVAYETETEIWPAASPDINDYIKTNGIPLFRHPFVKTEV